MLQQLCKNMLKASWLQAVEGVGIAWSFVDDDEGRNIHSFIVRLVACLVSIGGMLVTALMLGIVSGGPGQLCSCSESAVFEGTHHQHALCKAAALLAWRAPLAAPPARRTGSSNEPAGEDVRVSRLRLSPNLAAPRMSHDNAVQTMPVLLELCKANASEGGLPIVVLAQREKVCMRDLLHLLS